jgi:hypothetical protein
MNENKPLFDNAAILDDPELRQLVEEAQAVGELSPELDAKLMPGWKPYSTSYLRRWVQTLPNG